MRTIALYLVVTLLLLAGGGAQAGVSNADHSLSILVYHRFGATATELTTIRTATFEEQLQWLNANAVKVVPLHQVIDRLRAGMNPVDIPSVVLTDDDGHETVYTQMYPLILRYRVPVTLFVYPSAISNSKTALTWRQLSEISASGFVDVQSHTFWHPNFNTEKSRLAPADYERFVRNQLDLSRNRIETHLGSHVDLLAWPFGIHNPELEKMAAGSGYVAGFGIERKQVTSRDNVFTLPRFEVTDADRGMRFEVLVTGRPAKGRQQ